MHLMGARPISSGERPRLLRGIALCIVFLPLSMHGQSLEVLGREIQFHGYATQGFIHTDNNNWLTMNTSHVGSGQFTEFAVNASVQVSNKFRLGAQGFDRSLGELGEWHPSLDWAYADYRFANWFGVRGGKVKTTLGLYNDTQDLDFVRTVALLPQSVYPTDLRDATIAHLGGDVYGTFTLQHKLGKLAYTVYAGHRSDSIYSGYPYLFAQFGTYFKSFGGLQYGGDVRWTTPLKGLLVGASRLDQDTNGSGTALSLPDLSHTVPNTEHSRSDWMNQYYGTYSWKRLRLDSEYRRYYRNQIILSGSSSNVTDVRGWYFAGSYRVMKRLELGSYYSHYTITSLVGGLLATIGLPNQTDTSLPENHVYDKVVTARVDLTRFWNVKIEGHFMDGYGNSTYPDGFYPQVNPEGFKPYTNSLVIKTGMNF